MINLALLLFALAVTILWLRRRSLVKRTSESDASRRPAALPARLAETAVTGLVGLAILAMTATSRHSNGLLLSLEGEPTAVVVYSLAAFGAVLLGWLAATFVAWRGRGTAATLIAIVVLTGYGIALNGTGVVADLRQSAVSPQAQLAAKTLVFNLSSANIEGADVWVNGVHLGKTPVKIPLVEFLDRIPVWEQPPEAELPQGDKASVNGKYSNSADDRWLQTVFPNCEWMKLPADQEERCRKFDKQRPFARVEYQGEEGVSGRGSGGGGSDQNFGIGLNFRFPKREAAIETLLAQVSQPGQEIDAAWINAMQAFGDDGWIALRRASAENPQLQEVFDQWVENRYGLASVSSSDDALAKLKEIAAEADAANLYVTASLAGRAVEKIAPRLPSAALGAWAVRLIESTDAVNWSYFDFNGRQEYLVARPPARFASPGGGGSSFSSWGGTEVLPPSGLAVAHAVQTVLNESGDRPDRVALRAEIASALLKAFVQRRFIPGLKLAATLGGTDVEKFLLRKATGAVPRGEGVPHQDRMNDARLFDVNCWWYLAAHLHTPGGRDFRRRNATELMELADQAVEHYPSPSDIGDDMEFLFIDGGPRETNMAIQYWPRFRSRIVETHNPRPVDMTLAYLKLTGPATIPEDYVDAWRTNDYVHNALSKMRDVPPDKYRAVLGKLLLWTEDAAVASRPDWLAEDWARQSFREQITQELAWLDAANESARTK